MIVKVFGQYLLNNGILTAQQLADAMSYEQSTNTKIGVLAVNVGTMTAAQVEEVHRIQRIKDKRFGEIAVEKGYLTLRQLEYLLQVQSTRRLSLSQAIVDKGYLTLFQLQKALEAYKKDSRLSDEQWQVMQSTDFDKACELLLDFAIEDGLDASYREYVSLILKNILRFLNDIPVLLPNEALTDKVEGWVFTQAIEGEVNLLTGLMMDEVTLLEIARRYSQEDLTEVDALAKDSVAEFLNLSNGIFCVNASDKHMELNLRPQSITFNEFPCKVQGISIPIGLSFGSMELVIATKVED